MGRVDLAPIVGDSFDAVWTRMIRFGGWTGRERTGDTWEYDGKWTKLAAAGPTPRNRSAMIYDSRRKRAILFGGHDGNFVFGDLWEWDGSRWTERIATEPQKCIDNGH